MRPLELVERLDCGNYFGDFIAHGMQTRENTARKICAPPPIEWARAFG